MKKRSKVFLVAFDAKGAVVEEVCMSYDDYYEGHHDIIDSRKYRADKGIVKMTGEIYQSSGKLQDKFCNTYGSAGQLLQSESIRTKEMEESKDAERGK